MKLSDAHADRIAALQGCVLQLNEVAGQDTAYFIVGHLQTVARQLIAIAPEHADAGRLTHSIDSLRAAIDAFAAAIDIGAAKEARLLAAQIEQ